MKFSAYGNCQGRSSSLSEIMQIVLLAVRTIVALTYQEALSWFIGADWEQYLRAITPLFVGAYMTTFQCDVVKAC